MEILEGAKKVAEKLTGIGLPGKEGVAGLVRQRKPAVYRFKSYANIPNHPKWGLVIYRSPVRFPSGLDPAGVLEAVVAKNGWGDTWRNGIYDFVHYHSQIHEFLGVARGSAKVRFGGSRGRTLKVKAGDVAIIPAGTGHQLISASKDFLVVGAYPKVGTYDERRGTKTEFEAAVKRIARVRRPKKDPIFGADGSLLSVWKE